MTQVNAATSTHEREDARAHKAAKSHKSGHKNRLFSLPGYNDPEKMV